MSTFDKARIDECRKRCDLMQKYGHLKRQRYIDIHDDFDKYSRTDLPDALDALEEARRERDMLADALRRLNTTDWQQHDPTAAVDAQRLLALQGEKNADV